MDTAYVPISYATGTYVSVILLCRPQNLKRSAPSLITLAGHVVSQCGKKYYGKSRPLS